MPDTPSIAVLPFANMSNDPEQTYFCDGIAEDIINDLTRIEGLRVAARTTSFAHRAASTDIREIGRANRRGLSAGRKRPQRRQPSSHYRAAHRRVQRLPHLVASAGTVRSPMCLPFRTRSRTRSPLRFE
jgi:hypothetical protein